MIVSFMYHRIHGFGIENEVQRFSDHLRRLADQFALVWPGENSGNRPAACLTFDDAYFDFYHVVFPLLRQHRIKAVLAVPVKYILPTTDCATPQRLSVPTEQCMLNDVYQRQAPFCTWNEIREMHASGLVKVASHSYDHADLTQCRALTYNITESKAIIDQQLQQETDCFVYPYGKMTRAIHQQVKQHYQYAFRIGRAINRRWDESCLYRLNANPYWTRGRLPSALEMGQFQFKYWQNKLRKK